MSSLQDLKKRAEQVLPGSEGDGLRTWGRNGSNNVCTYE
jgi:hypothetical protein